MSNEYVSVRNTATRKVGLVRRRIAEHEVFGRHLEIVPDGTKSYVSLDELIHGRREPETVEDLVALEDFDPEEYPDETEEA